MDPTMKNRSKKKSRRSPPERGLFALLNKVSQWLHEPGTAPAGRSHPLDLAQLEDRVLYNVAPVGGVAMDPAAAQLHLDQLDHLITTLVVPDGAHDAAPVVDASHVGILPADGDADPLHDTSHDAAHESESKFQPNTSDQAPADTSVHASHSLGQFADPPAATADAVHPQPVVENKDATPRHELIVVDKGVENYEALLQDVQNQRSDGTRQDIVVLDNQRDGVEQI